MTILSRKQASNTFTDCMCLNAMAMSNRMQLRIMSHSNLKPYIYNYIYIYASKHFLNQP